MQLPDVLLCSLQGRIQGFGSNTGPDGPGQYGGIGSNSISSTGIGSSSSYSSGGGGAGGAGGAGRSSFGMANTQPLSQALGTAANAIGNLWQRNGMTSTLVRLRIIRHSGSPLYHGTRQRVHPLPSIAHTPQCRCSWLLCCFRQPDYGCLSTGILSHMPGCGMRRMHHPSSALHAAAVIAPVHHGTRASR
jgi:hypothetical protein